MDLVNQLRYGVGFGEDKSGRRPVVKLLTDSKPDFNYNDNYSENSSWYFLTFKPYNDQYNKNKAWYEFKGIDYVRKLLPKGKYLITRETESTKIHINVLISTETDLKTWHDKAGRKYKIWCNRLADQVHDCVTIYDYITKESQTRTFNKFLDYIVYNGPKKRNSQTPVPGDA